MTDDVTGKRMVVGFLFSGPLVLLVRKEKPAWQARLMNGVGGVIESNETPVAAMVREFEEETSFQTDGTNWRHYATEREPFGAWVYFFASDLKQHSRDQAKNFAWPRSNDSGEELCWINSRDLEAYGRSNQIIGNLQWLIPLALDPRGFEQPVLVEARGDIRERASW